MGTLAARVDAAAGRAGFSGVVRVDRGDEVRVLAAYGWADRAHGVPLTPDHRLGTASLTKGLTAITVMSLVADGALSLGTTARSVLGDDLPLIDDGVTVEHLLSQRSGIGDYLDEELLESADDHVMPVPVHRLESSDDYLAILGGHPQRTPPGTEVRYNNGAFVVLAVLAERVSGVPFAELVVERVCDPAGLAATRFLRMDELPGDAARGYLDADGLRTNVLHLPVRGSGDGGCFTTAADLRTLWLALLDGRLLPERWVQEMRRPRVEPVGGSLGYGLGLWLHASGALELHGYDAGASSWTVHDPASASTWTVLSNVTGGVRDVIPVLADDLPG
jgi:CubicO group peptidase (beta-lactamase class C family)